MSTSPTAEVGANIRAEMARRGVTQLVMAEHLRLTQSVVSKRLKGETPWDINELAAVSQFLGVPLESLLPRPQPAVEVVAAAS